MKGTSIKFHLNLSSGSCIDTCRWTDITKSIGNFRNCVKAPPKHNYLNNQYIL